MKTRLYIQGMTCSRCESKIRQQLLRIEAVKDVHVNASRDIAIIDHEVQLNMKKISDEIASIGYKVVERSRYQNVKRFLLLTTLVILSYFVLRFGNALSFDFLPNIRQNMGYGALLVVGMITSAHCVIMCGGINISQCNKYSYLKPSVPTLLYNLGRITSYTVLGGIIGGVGSILSFSGQMRGYITIGISVVMVLLALKMLKLFQVRLPAVRFGSVIKRPFEALSKKGPFLVGLANGFMPCGPLQSMQLYALGTGSVVRGALSMFYFALGSFPLMFAIGLISSMLNFRFSKNIMKLSSLLILLLGLNMFSRGAALAGIVIPFQYDSKVIESSILSEGAQEVHMDLSADHYEALRVKKDIPVKLVINADESDLNGCNNPITIPSLGITRTIVPGRNEIEFLPDAAGKIAYTCWMGMISSFIEVVE